MIDIRLIVMKHALNGNFVQEFMHLPSNYRANVSNTGMMTWTSHMMLEGASLWSTKNAEPLQTMKSGNLPS